MPLIIKIKGSINVALKNVYALGHVSRFERKLEKRIRSQEKDIEQMCGIHYHKFVESLNDIRYIFKKINYFMTSL